MDTEQFANQNSSVVALNDGLLDICCESELLCVCLYRNPNLDDQIFDSKNVTVKSSMARSLPVENLLPQNVGSFINYLH